MGGLEIPESVTWSGLRGVAALGQGGLGSPAQESEDQRGGPGFIYMCFIPKGTGGLTKLKARPPGHEGLEGAL